MVFASVGRSSDATCHQGQAAVAAGDGVSVRFALKALRFRRAAERFAANLGIERYPWCDRRIAKPRGAAPELALHYAQAGRARRITAGVMRPFGFDKLSLTRCPFRRIPALPPGRKVRLARSPHFSAFRQPYGLKQKAFCSLGAALCVFEPTDSASAPQDVPQPLAAFEDYGGHERGTPRARFPSAGHFKPPLRRARCSLAQCRLQVAGIHPFPR